MANELRTTIDEAVKSSVQDVAKESWENMHKFDKVHDWAKVVANLGQNGTDIAKNVADPLGDGDQSPIFNRDHAQVHRDVWSAGGDVQHLLLTRNLPPFVIGCLVGSLEICKKLLSECDTEQKKKALLETKYSVLRLSPIFFATIGFATMGFMGAGTIERKNVEVVKLLLEAGARVDARDFCGKTVVHYCAGPLCVPGSTTLLEIADLCIARAQELNLPPLVDARDRFGGVALLQPVMMNRVDLVAFLCTKHHADALIRDNDNVSAESMAELNFDIRTIINKARNNPSGVVKNQCLNCLVTDVDTSKCKRCMVATYCSRDCQVKHWKTHKKVCVEVTLNEPGIIISVDPAPKANVTYSASGTPMKSWDGQVPAGLNVNEQFEIKVQVGSVAEMPFLLYNQARSVELSVSSKNCAKYQQLFNAISAFEPCKGRRAYMTALITDKGELSVNNDVLFVREW